MNWMTSGRHRALRTKRGKKRSEMHFPAHVQRELTRVRRHPLAQTEDAGARNSDGTAWYIRPVMDFNQSHDIQMLELAREAATGAAPTRTEATSTSSTQKKKEAEEKEAKKPEEAQEKKTAERRCVFTPVKANRQRPRATEQVNPRAVKKPPSPPPRDLLLFNEGEQLARPVSSRVAISGQASGQTRQAESQKSKYSRFEDNLGSQKRNKSSQRQQQEASSLPFYAASSSSDEEAPASIDCRRGIQSGRFSSEAWDVKDNMSLNRCHEEKESRPNSLNLFQSIEREIQSKRQSHVELPQSIDEDDKAYVTHELRRSSQPIRELHTGQFHSLGEAATRFAPLEHLKFSKSMREDECLDSSQVSKRRRCSSPPPEDPRKQRLLQARVEVDKDCESPESTSSQESLVLPPPVDWHKQMVTRAVEENMKQAANPVGASGSYQDGDLVEPLFCESTHSSSTKWTISSRTKMIFRKFVEDQLSPSEDDIGLVDERAALQQRLDEQEGVTLYLFTLLQCHNVDEECQKIAMTSNDVDEPPTEDSP